MKKSLEIEISRALKTLPEKEAAIIQMYYGLNNKNTTYSLTEIGETFNITRERVRQVKQRALNKLKSKSRATVLRTYL